VILVTVEVRVYGFIIGEGDAGLLYHRIVIIVAAERLPDDGMIVSDQKGRDRGVLN
jgi:hypothetical protein